MACCPADEKRVVTTELRELCAGDESDLLDLFCAVLPGFTDLLAPGESGPLVFLEDAAGFAFGAYVDGVPAGLAWGVCMRYPNGRSVAYLHELDVLDEFRRRGIATMLVERSMTLARERGASRFWLSTGGHNDVAQALYDSLGGERKRLGDVNYWWNLS